MDVATDEDVVDPAEGPVPIDDERVTRCERVTRLTGVRGNVVRKVLS